MLKVIKKYVFDVSDLKRGNIVLIEPCKGFKKIIKPKGKTTYTGPNGYYSIMGIEKDSLLLLDIQNGATLKAEFKAFIPNKENIWLAIEKAGIIEARIYESDLRDYFDIDEDEEDDE